MSINALFGIAKSALTTSQQALAVTGHNIANVSTPGYTRQEAVLTEKRPINGAPGQVGTGVQAREIRRLVDTFLERQITDSHESVGRLSVAQQELARLEQLFVGQEGQGLSGGIAAFFKAVQDVATNPSDLSARAVLLSKAGALSSQFNQTAGALESTRQAFNAQVGLEISTVNDLSRRIAELNGEIARVEVTGQNANDLRDQRGLLINDLASHIDISTLEQKSGEVSVFIARGLVLVDGHISRRLAGVESADNNGLLDVRYDVGGNTATSVSNLITNGRLKALLDLRDETVPELLRSVDSLAGSLSNEVNQLHRQGYGLDGTTGNSLFSSPAVTTHAAGTNVGTATVGSSAIAASSLLTFHDYEIQFASGSIYSIVDATTGASIKGNYTGTSIAAPTVDAPLSIVTGVNDQLTLTVDGVASGTITLAGAATPGLAYTNGASVAAVLQTKINADSALTAAGKRVSVTYDTTANRFVITSNTAQPTSSVNVTGGTARASLGLVAGTSTAASGTYGSPQTFVIDGISVAVNGAPVANDLLTVNSRTNTARDLSVVLTNAAKVAASASRSGLPGNGDNAQAISSLQSQALVGLGQATPDEFYRTTVGNLGVQAQVTEREAQAQDVVHEQLQTFRASVSGVSLDQELVDLLKYQRMFEAASRLIVTADELLQTILAMKR